MAYLTLSNGAIFEGRRIGAPVDRMDELVFSTSMAGYPETLADPSYYGQIRSSPSAFPRSAIMA